MSKIPLMLGDEPYGRSQYGHLLKAIDEGRLELPATMTREEVLELLHCPSIGEGTAPWRIMSLLAESDTGFVVREAVYEKASIGATDKTRNTVVSRLISAGYIQYGYFLTTLGRRALVLARPLAKTQPKAGKRGPDKTKRGPGLKTTAGRG